jgi:hypothetical protein
METKLINFEGGQILGVKDEQENIWMGIKKACTDIGLTDGQARRQVQNISDDVVLKQGVTKMRLLTKGGKQEVLCIKEDFVTLWLAKIKLTPTMQKENPKAVDKLVKYQLKAAKVLHEAFMATEEQKQEFYDEMGLKGEIVDLKNEVVTLSNRVDSLIDNSTINTRQAQKLLACARDKIRELLGDTHSINYKKYSRIYFKNLWNNFGDHFNVGTYKDLCPIHYDEGFDFINNWKYVA